MSDAPSAEPTARSALLIPALALSVATFGGAFVVGSGPQSGESVQIRVDVNSASRAELQLLPGIGPALSQAIVLDRAEAGPFGALDDLERVSRIGPRTVLRIGPHARVR